MPRVVGIIAGAVGMMMPKAIYVSMCMVAFAMSVSYTRLCRSVIRREEVIEELQSADYVYLNAQHNQKHTMLSI